MKRAYRATCKRNDKIKTAHIRRRRQQHLDVNVSVRLSADLFRVMREHAEAILAAFSVAHASVLRNYPIASLAPRLRPSKPPNEALPKLNNLYSYVATHKCGQQYQGQPGTIEVVAEPSFSCRHQPYPRSAYSASGTTTIEAIPR